MQWHHHNIVLLWLFIFSLTSTTLPPFINLHHKADIYLAWLFDFMLTSSLTHLVLCYINCIVPPWYNPSTRVQQPAVLAKSWGERERNFGPKRRNLHTKGWGKKKLSPKELFYIRKEGVCGPIFSKEEGRRKMSRGGEGPDPTTLLLLLLDCHCHPLQSTAICPSIASIWPTILSSRPSDL